MYTMSNDIISLTTLEFSIFSVMLNVSELPTSIDTWYVN